MPSAGILSKIMTGLEKAIEWAVTVLIGVMVVNIITGVFGRFVLKMGLPYTEELGRYLMIWAGYLGIALALKDGSHIAIRMVVELFPPAGRRVINFISRLIVTVFLGVVVVTSFTHLRTLSIQKSSAMEIPMVIPYLAVTVGAFLAAVVNIIYLLGYQPSETPAEAK
jgi:TRAP-type C4-dicarboxylate transport system permease small subunit